MKKPKGVVSKFHPSFIGSLLAFLKLSKAGFRITHSKSKVSDLEINRFWWNGESVPFPDIDKVDEHYYTMFNGVATPLYPKKGDKNASRSKSNGR